MKARSFAILLILGAGLGGCAEQVQTFQDQLNDFNPMGTRKARLPGERKAMFPEGVPGVQQGVPSELMKGAPREPEVVEPAVVTPAKPEAKPARSRRVRTAAKVKPPRQPRPARQSEQAETPQSQPVPARPAASGNWQSPPSAAPAAAWPDPPKAQ